MPPPYPTWGGMLSLAGLDHMYQAPWLAIRPAVALSLAVFGFNMLGDTLRDLLDPASRAAADREEERVDLADRRAPEDPRRRPDVQGTVRRGLT